MILTRLVTNFKGVTTDVPLSQKCAVVGENRSGKTALLRAVKLALTPNPPAAQASRYFKLAPKGATDLYSRLFIDNELVASFTVAKDGKGRIRAAQQSFDGDLGRLPHDQIAQLLPSSSFRDLVDLGDKKAREEIFRRFGQISGVAQIPQPPTLAGEEVAMWQEGIQVATHGQTDPAVVLAAAAEWFRAEKLRLAKEVRDAKKDIAEMSARVQTLVAGAELIPELEKQYDLAVIHDNLDLSRQGLAAAQRDRALLDAEGAAFAAREQEIEVAMRANVQADEASRAEIDALLARRQELENAIHDNETRLSRINALLDTIVLTDADAVAFRKAGRDVWALSQDEVNKLREERAYEIGAAQLQRTTIDQDIARLRAHGRVDTAMMQARLKQDRASWESRSGLCDQRLEIFSKTIASVASYEGPSASEIKQTLDDLRNGQALRRQLEEMEVAVRQKKVFADVAKELESKAETLLESLLKKVSSGAESAVNRYMPSGFTAKLELGGGECRWCVLNATDGEPSDKDVMCGAEKAALTVALALAWTEGAPVRIVTLDDEDLGPFHSSPENLRSLLLALDAAVDDGHLTQLIVAGLRRDEVPAGWDVVVR